MNKTNSRQLNIKLSKKKNTVLILTILAVLIGHFAVQMSFIQSETTEAITKILPNSERNLADKTKLVQQPGEVKTDIVVTDKPLEINKVPQAEKIVQRETKPLNEPAPKVNSTKKETVSKSERLRRAEKLLTGF